MNKPFKKKVVRSDNLSIFASKRSVRTVVFYKNYFADFYSQQRPKTKAKIDWTLRLIEELQFIPETFLKRIHKANGLYEVRAQQGGDIFRIFCFWDANQLVVIINGFQKKTQKTPKKEIDKAIKIKNEYFNEKK